MAVVVNLRHLEAVDAHLQGEVPAEELDIDPRDEVIRLTHPLEYDLSVSKHEGGLLLQGKLRLVLSCRCVRCLADFEHQVVLDPWTAHVALSGEDALPVVNDCVDVLPVLREDILLDFPQHPVCNAACRGLPKASPGKAQSSGVPGAGTAGSPAWAELNKLKF